MSAMALSARPCVPSSELPEDQRFIMSAPPDSITVDATHSISGIRIDAVITPRTYLRPSRFGLVRGKPNTSATIANRNWPLLPDRIAITTPRMIADTLKPSIQRLFPPEPASAPRIMQ